MLFSSYVFILVFLPITLLGFGICSQRGKTASLLWLLVASCVFYGYWNPIHLPLIAASILINFQLGRWLVLRPEPLVRRLCLLAGVVLNLGLIAYFKYFGFFARAISMMSKNNVPRVVSSTPFCAPLFENGWHGAQPARTRITPFLGPKSLFICPAVTLRISVSINSPY